VKGKARLMFSLFVPNLMFEQSDALKVPEHLRGAGFLLVPSPSSMSVRNVVNSIMAQYRHWR
jgi:hypothetical protein